MSGTVILLVVIVATYYLGKYAISEGQKIENNKCHCQKEWEKKINNMWIITTTFGDGYEITYTITK